MVCHHLTKSAGNSYYSGRDIMPLVYYDIKQDLVIIESCDLWVGTH